MSHNTGNFVHELVIMAKAFEELPKVRAELDETKQRYDAAQSVIQELQLRIIDLKNATDEARANTRKVEAERDDLELRFLEADDKIAGFTRLIKDQAKAFGLLLEAVEPTKPEPVNEPTVQAEPTTQPAGQHWSEADEANHQRAVDPTPVTADGGDGTSGQSDMREAEAEINSDMLLPPQEVNELEEWAARPLDPELPVPGYPTEGVSVPADPTAVAQPVETGPDASSSGAETTTNVSAPITTEQSSSSGSASEDDVGYHNEPNISTEPGGWQAWDSWCTRMNRRYGGGSWPARPATA